MDRWFLIYVVKWCECAFVWASISYVYVVSCAALQWNVLKEYQPIAFMAKHSIVHNFRYQF